MKLNNVILLCTFLMFGIIACDKDDDVADEMENEMEMKDDDDASDILGAAGDFTLMELDGGTFKLSDQQGVVTVLFFFGNTCPSCKAAVSEIQSNLVDAYSSNSNYQLVGIDVWDGNESAVNGFKTSTGASFKLLLNGSSVAAGLGTTYDRLLVIDANGAIAFMGTRGASNDISDAVAVVNEELSK